MMYIVTPTWKIGLFHTLLWDQYLIFAIAIINVLDILMQPFMIHSSPLNQVGVQAAISSDLSGRYVAIWESGLENKNSLV